MRHTTVFAMLSLVTAAAPFMLGDAAALGVQDREASRTQRRTPVVDVFESTRDAVVSINSTEIVTVRSRSPFDSFFDDFFDLPRRGGMRKQERHSVGSGFVVHPDGYIVTNAHVIARTTEQRVVFADGREFDAQIIAADTSRDLAVLKVESASPLPTLTLGRSDDLMIGETVIAIGNPLGYQHTVTAGVVSAIDREVQISPELSFVDLIQTDASINPGNSGGPLLNVLGELIGINSAIRGDAQNIGFAIPVDHLREVLPDLLDVKRRNRFETGLAIDYLVSPRVTQVLSNSPADEAGIRVGDELLAVDGRPVNEGIDFDIALIDRHPDDDVPLMLRRDGRKVRTSLRLVALPAPDGRALAREKLGIQAVPLPPDIAGRLGLDGSRGILIERVESGGPADEAGIERYDVVMAIDRQYVSSIDDLGQLLERLDTGDVITVRILRVERRRKTQRAGPLQIR